MFVVNLLFLKLFDVMIGIFGVKFLLKVIIGVWICL